MRRKINVNAVQIDSYKTIMENRKWTCGFCKGESEGWPSSLGLCQLCFNAWQLVILEKRGLA